jgi:hypothetical protein
MPASTYLNNKILDLVFGGTAYSARPTTLYFALFTSAPNASGGGTEVSGAGYTRKAVTANTTNFPAIVTAGDNISSAVDIAWPIATGSWGTVTSWGIYDASSSGNLLFFDSLDTPVDITTGQKPKIASAALTISLSGEFGNLIEKSVLNHIFASVAWPGYATHYFALGTGATSAGLTGEASGTGYARKSLTNSKAAIWGTASDSVVTNDYVIAFASAGGSWGGAMAYWGIYDALTSGNLLWYGSIGTPVTISSGIYQWGVGELKINLG